MNIFKKLFMRKSQKFEGNQSEPFLILKQAERELPKEWETVPSFIELERKEYVLPALIASSIAAGDHPDSSYKIKRILKRNPEAQLVSLITTSIATGDYPDSRFIVKSIKKRIN